MEKKKEKTMHFFEQTVQTQSEPNSTVYNSSLNRSVISEPFLCYLSP